MKDKLHEAISEDNELEASKILQDYAMRWFGFGLGVGFVVTALIFGLLQ